jgi:hypothetical protein
MKPQITIAKTAANPSAQILKIVLSNTKKYLQSL